LTAGIGVSHQTSEDWIRRTHLPASRVVTIHNGIDPERFQRRTERQAAKLALGLSPKSLVVGAVGRLDEAKGMGYLISGVAELAGEYSELVLVIAGEGPLHERLTRQAESLGIGSRVRFLGFQQDVQSVLHALDIFALPSLCETLGYAHLEAMATCLPAIGTSVGGVPEVIVNGETGLLVPPRDAVALASALRTLIDSPDLRTQMGMAGRERVEKYFTEREMVSKTIELYRRLLGNCATGGH
jgi:glycosyltransferase involved in cell wall biosynthesis